MCEMNVVAKYNVKWKQDKTAKPLAVYVLPKSSFGGAWILVVLL